MSGDLEDFLRRAAQRRQAKAAQSAPAEQPRPRSQYSDRRTERVVDAIVVEEPVTAEIVEENSLVARQKRLEESRRAAAEAEAGLKKRAGKAAGGHSVSGAVALGGDSTADLIRLLRQPNGIRQAILLREVLDRPEHRW